MTARHSPERIAFDELLRCTPLDVPPAPEATEPAPMPVRNIWATYTPPVMGTTRPGAGQANAVPSRIGEHRIYPNTGAKE